MFGRILCCSICPIIKPGKTEKPFTLRGDEKPWRSKDPIDDASLAVGIRDALEKFHLIVGWNSRGFDLSFLNARLVAAGERPLKPQFHLDAMWLAGQFSLRIGSRKLDVVQKFLRLPESKTPIEWEDWKRAALGDTTAMRRVQIHCEQDVKVLAQAYWKLLPMVSNIHR